MNSKGNTEAEPTNLVFDISNVHDEIDFIAKIVSQNSPDHVLRQVIPGRPRASVSFEKRGHGRHTSRDPYGPSRKQ